MGFSGDVNMNSASMFSGGFGFGDLTGVSGPRTDRWADDKGVGDIGATRSQRAYWGQDPSQDRGSQIKKTIVLLMGLLMSELANRRGGGETGKKDRDAFADILRKLMGRGEAEETEDSGDLRSLLRNLKETLKPRRSVDNDGRLHQAARIADREGNGNGRIDTKEEVRDLSRLLRAQIDKPRHSEVERDLMKIMMFLMMAMQSGERPQRGSKMDEMLKALMGAMRNMGSQMDNRFDGVDGTLAEMKKILEKFTSKPESPPVAAMPAKLFSESAADKGSGLAALAQSVGAVDPNSKDVKLTGGSTAAQSGEGPVTGTTLQVPGLLSSIVFADTSPSSSSGVPVGAGDATQNKV